jgi:UDP-2,4-diacetamido-2,4,6-trideoxy-beta-L-altropyranose hydrolase
MSWPVAFRVDADSAMGAGHFMRCLSLAYACRARGGEPVFFTSTTVEGLLSRIRAAGFDHVQIEPDSPDLGARAVGVWASANKQSWFVLDGYQFQGAFQLVIAQSGARLMVIDDYVRLPRYHADMILDQNLSSETRRYPVAPTCRLLLGPNYALLAPAFIEANVEERTYPERVRRILVTLGAADPVRATSLVLSALGSMDMTGMDVTVVIGGANPHGAEIRQVSESSRFRVVADVANMPELMSEADLAITAAGTTSLEICRMGLPAVIITLVDNQRDIAAALADSGAGIGMGWHEDVTEAALRDAILRLVHDRAERERISLTGRQLVDGHGASRVVSAMLAKTTT